MTGKSLHIGILRGGTHGLAFGEGLSGGDGFSIGRLGSGEGFFEKFRSPADLADHENTVGVVHAPVETLVTVEIEICGLVDAAHGEPLGRGINPQAGAPD